ncbi:PfkB family carbohydrate kinase [Youngiibacter multivorans]|uniref:Sugar/nucleoside kinase (Ribokinase family) n=1 Tax=Youngiibacter multivorans TaxID=937251 RepID=A0ABS4G834_9CLOT|nr:PfkB family carbohydrate kinase [Youngiibacter multivorans]MBP1920696.1 sugar/nucleoside kinase (ribokinase family) [Youngiibacter multivorans]
MKVIGIGDNVCDKYLNLKKMYPGGQALNFAAFCRMNGIEASYMGVFGSDDVARHILNTLSAMGIDYSRSRFYDGENGYAVVDIVDGDRVFVRSNKGGMLREHPLELTEADLEYIRSFDVIHTSNNSYMDKELSKLKGLVPILSYDFSLSWKDDERLRSVAPLIDAAIMSCSGLTMEECRDLALRVHGMGTRLVLMTMGEDGSMFYDGTEFYRHRPVQVKPLDTLGAGDSFTAGFLAIYATGTLVDGIGPEDTLYNDIVVSAFETGSRMAAEVCMRYGAFGEGMDFDEA